MQSNSPSCTKDSNEDETKSDALPPTTDGEDADESRHKLFVGGLPYDVTDPELWDFFSQFGELHESEVMFDRQKRRPRGFGFVTYTNPDVSKSLLQMGNGGDGIGRLVMRGKTCEVKTASPKPPDSPARGGGGTPSKSGRGSPGLCSEHCLRSPGEHHDPHYYQQQHRLSPSFGPDGQFPVVHHQHDNYAMVCPQGAPSWIPSVSGFAPPVFHPSAMLLHHPIHPPPQGTIPPFVTPPIAAPLYPPAMPQIPANYYFPHYQQHGNYEFVPNPTIVPAPMHFCA